MELYIFLGTLICVATKLLNKKIIINIGTTLYFEVKFFLQ